jgi:hypothetical protein
MGHEHRIMKQKWSGVPSYKEEEGDKIKDPTKVATQTR